MLPRWTTDERYVCVELDGMTRNDPEPAPGGAGSGIEATQPRLFFPAFLFSFAPPLTSPALLDGTVRSRIVLSAMGAPLIVCTAVNDHY